MKKNFRVNSNASKHLALALITHDLGMRYFEKCCVVTEALKHMKLHVLLLVVCTGGKGISETLQSYEGMVSFGTKRCLPV